LWAADEAERGRLFAQPIPLSLRRLKGLRTFATDPIAQLQAALPIAAAADPAAYDLRPPAVRRTGARIVRLLAAVVSQSDAAVPVHRALRLAWAPRRAALDEVIRTALVLCADHELNVSAFAARCAASAGATPYDVVSAALATLKGYRHGGAGERALALIAETEPARATAVISERMRRGDRVPGFGHPLYPDGDPRAVALLRLAEAGANEAERRRVVRLQKAGAELLEEHPNLDFGLAAVARAWGLPDRAPIVLFALGRTVGWIAHAIEEYASGGLIRPRARYVGPRPAARP
jgi:citrate synthase